MPFPESPREDFTPMPLSVMAGHALCNVRFEVLYDSAQQEMNHFIHEQFTAAESGTFMVILAEPPDTGTSWLGVHFIFRTNANEGKTLHSTGIIMPEPGTQLFVDDIPLYRNMPRQTIRWQDINENAVKDWHEQDRAPFN